MSARKPSAELIYNLITNLPVDNFEDIQRDLDLFYRGYRFYYVIDSYDIIRYFLPFVEKGFFKIDQENPNRLANEFVAYDKIFALNQFKNLVIPSEYQFEILRKNRELDRRIRSIAEDPSVQDFLRKVDKLSPSEKQQFVKNNAEIFITLLILTNGEGRTNRSFHSFIRNRIQPALASREVVSRIKGEFSEGDPVADVDDAVGLLYDRFVEQQTPHLLGMETDLKRYHYLENSYSDIQVIERMRRVNCRADVDGRKIFLYCSSAQPKSDTIFSLINVPQSTLVQPPRVNGYYPYNFYRNIYQLFIFMVLTEEFPRKPEESDQNGREPKEILSLLIKLVEQKQTLNYDSLDSLYPGAQLALNNYSAAIDNHFLFNIYRKYRPAQLSEDEPLVSTDEVERVLLYVDRYMQEHPNKPDLRYNITRYRETHALANLIDKKTKNRLRIVVPFGSDIISNNFHHLPNLLFYRDEEQDKNFFDILLLINEVTHKDDVGAIAAKIKPLIIKIFSEYTDDPEAYPSAGSITGAYINLFLRTSLEDDESSDRETEKDTVYILKRLKRLLGSAFSGPGQTNDRIILVAKQNKYLDEINYLLLWLLRRNERIEEAVLLGEKLVAKHKDDPRLTHGLALALIARSYEKPGIFQNTLSQKDEPIVKADLIRALLLLEQTIGVYKQLIELETRSSVCFLLQSTLTAVLNSFVSTRLRLFELGGEVDFDLVIGARPYLEQCKSLFSGLRLEYDKYQIYNITEAELEYFEAKQALKAMDLSTANTKIVFATRRINTAAKAKKSAVRSQFFKVEERIGELFKVILRKRGVL